jgi:hypothetical protein
LWTVVITLTTTLTALLLVIAALLLLLVNINLLFIFFDALTLALLIGIFVGCRFVIRFSWCFW